MNRFTVLRTAFFVSLIALPLQAKDIVDTAVSAGSFKTLVAAVKAADLVDTLKSDGPFTVFAPTDEAFAKLPKGTLAELLKPENKSQLQSILTYHVVAGKVVAGDLLNVNEAKTVQGAAAKFGLTVEGANIIKTDIQCSNGVIHVIDAVILPPKVKETVARKMPMAPSKAVNPRAMIRDAITEGSHLYNTGHACECANLYTKTMTQLWRAKAMPSKMKTHISHTLEVANHETSSDKRAWVLRRGLDSLYHNL